MTSAQLEQARALAVCRFSPGTTTKRFVRWALSVAESTPARELSPFAAAFLDKLAHSYRRQLGRCMSVHCEACK